MLDFFQPATKVQKDKRIIKETDERMAKYSRRGIVVNFIVFVFCILSGDFLTRHPLLSLVLFAGIALFTIARGYYLYRFSVLYPKAPKKWRNKYFTVTLLGGLWWGVILASFTLTLGFKDQTYLIWVYTIVFFSTTASAFAPYSRFLSYYQFVAIIPAAISVVALISTDGYS